MPTVVFTVTNNRIPQLIERLRDAVADAVEDTAREIETNIKIGMEAPHSGRMYGKHQASAPGEMPAIDTSALVNSIQVEPEGDLTQVVYTNQEYAAELEYGAPWRRILPRPFMVPASEAAADSFERRLSDLEGRL